MTAPPRNEGQEMAQYDMSPQQNQVILYCHARMGKAQEDLASSEREAEQARLLYEAKMAVVSARRERLAAETAARDRFLSYVIGEFSLPATKDNAPWVPREVEAGRFSLFAPLPTKETKETDTNNTGEPKD